jgi:hypothetical protein
MYGNPMRGIFGSGFLLREQYEDWKKTFMPVELQALQQLSFNNPNVLPDALKEAEETVSGAFNAMQGVAERQNKALGLQPTQQQEATTKRLIDLREAAALAGAKNDARASVRQMDEAILMGTTPNPKPQRTIANPL